MAPAPTPVPKLVVDASKPMPAGLDETAMDLTADPCGDFYQYACGGWMARTEIPADRPLYSRGFVAITDTNEKLLKAIAEEARDGKLPRDTPFAKQLGDFFASCTDEAALEKALPEANKLIAQVARNRTPADLARSLAVLHRHGVQAFFAVGAMQDFKDSSEVIAALDQGGLGLPDRDYYVEDDARKKAIREAYPGYIAQVLRLAGDSEQQAQAAAATILDLETRLARASQTKVERRTPQNVYHRLERPWLAANAKAFPWEVYFKELQVAWPTVNLNSTGYFEAVARVVTETRPEAWNQYLRFVVLRSTTLALPKAFQEAAFTFAAKHFTGAKEDRPRWKKCVASLDDELGEALGREFVRRHFGEDGKARTSAVVEALLASFEGNLETLAWMDGPTKEKARQKAKVMVGNNKVGYPKAWRDYTALSTTRASFLANVLASNRFAQARELAKVGKPVDRTEWYMSPPTVNAYYDPSKNEIVFPAGILQPPFFNKAATDAVNFGAMGMVVGHEITHGFDDEGRQFDDQGNLKDWWSPQVGEAYQGKAACVRTQYDGYVAIDDIKLKGDLTLGENIADLGGLKLAHRAMSSWYAGGKATAQASERYTPSQQFFLGFAQSWCTKVRPEMARLRAATDPHANPYWRVNGPLSNLQSFREAFQCQEGARMVRPAAQRCEVW